jgi:Cu+-exporting ATPase
VVAFDKTGTLTEGKPAGALEPHGIADDELLAWAAAIQQGSEHPLARAVMRARAMQRDLEIPAAQPMRALPGRGMAAVVAGRELRLGSPR